MHQIVRDPKALSTCNLTSIKISAFNAGNVAQVVFTILFQKKMHKAQKAAVRDEKGPKGVHIFP